MNIDLSGQWRAAPSNDALRRSYQDHGFDDTAWSDISVPGHWQRTPGFADNDAALMYRTRFDVPRSTNSDSDISHRARSWLTFDGIFYQADVWLDGTYLGDTEGYFFPNTFEVTEQLDQRSDHLLAVEVNCAPQQQRNRKRNITGVFQHWNAVDPTRNPGGIWRPVRITSSGPVKVRHARVTCADASADSATVHIRCVLDSSSAADVTVRTSVAGVTLDAPHQLRVGDNVAEWNVMVPQPELWWPRSLGDQPLHDVKVEIIGPDGQVSDSFTRRIGFRSVEMRGWVTSINGERLHLKGTNLGPTDYWLGETTVEDHRRDLQLALDANLDLVRIHGHISLPDIYDAADELGVLIWQDFPLQSRYHRSIRKQAGKQAREAVDLLAHHPSLIIWCARNEPLSISGADTPVADQRTPSVSTRAAGTPRPRTFARAIFDQQLPTYNKSVIDRTVSWAIRRADGSRPVVEHSGMVPTLPSLDGTDTHLYFGWYHNDERSLPAFCATMPRMVRFVSEFGAQSVPVGESVLEPFRSDPNWPHIDWSMLATKYSAQLEFLELHVPSELFPDFDSWAQETRDYQAMVIRFQVETLRRLKYRPSGGFAQFFLTDSAPGITHSIVSHNRRPKEAYEALKQACRPVLPIADRLPAHLHGGEPLSIDVHVVSDLRDAISDAKLVATLKWADGQRTHQFGGAIPADSVERVGTIDFDVPEVDGPLTLHLALSVGDAGREHSEVIESTYKTYIFHSPHSH